MLSTTTTSTTLVGSSTPVAELPGGDAASTTTTLPLAVPTTSALVVSPTTTSTAVAPFALLAPWPPGGAIDARYTCDGDGLSPRLIWTAPPAGTVELALLVTDDDADGFVHWAVAGIAPSAGEVGEGATITGSYEGINGAGSRGWTGPCPPAGGPHTYRFRMFALSQASELPDGYGGDELEQFAGATAVGTAEASGAYTRAG